MGWSIVAVEGFCGGDAHEGKYPCGRKYPTASCLEEGMCPFFGYSATTERDVAHFVPIAQILKDRIAYWASTAWANLQWWCWGQLPFNRRKVVEFFKRIPVAKSCPEYNEQLRQATADFATWLEKLKEVSQYPPSRHKGQG